MKRWWISFLLIILIPMQCLSVPVDPDTDTGRSTLSAIINSLHASGVVNESDIMQGGERDLLFLSDNSSLNGIIRPFMNESNLLCLIINSEGRIIYTSHPSECSKIPPDNVVTEVPTFREVIPRMIHMKTGSMFYDVWHAEKREPKSRRAFWDTTMVHGTELRVMIGLPL